MQKIRGFNPHRSHMAIKEVTDAEQFALLENHLIGALEVIEVARIIVEDDIEVSKESLYRQFAEAKQSLEEVVRELRIMSGAEETVLDRISVQKKGPVQSP